MFTKTLPSKVYTVLKMRRFSESPSCCFYFNKFQEFEVVWGQVVINVELIEQLSFCGTKMNPRIMEKLLKIYISDGYENRYENRYENGRSIVVLSCSHFHQRNEEGFFVWREVGGVLVDWGMSFSAPFC